MAPALPVILCGGSGTRLWPLSRELYPKQLLSLYDDGSLLQNTVTRLKCVSGIDYMAPLVVCNEQHRFLVAEQLRRVGVRPAIMLEPKGRNTAPALALAALKARRDYGDATLVVLPSDHAIADDVAFARAMEQSINLADEGYLVTLGITPTHAETGYGYIQSGRVAGPGYVVNRFVEKPELSAAQAYVAAGDHFWNSGMFVLRARTYLEELARFRPDILEAVERAMAASSQDLDFERIDAAAFAACPAESIDYAVMEPTERAVMVPLDAGWNDVGSWYSLWDISEKTEEGNALQGDVITQDVTDTLIHADHRLVSAVGVRDLVIVETADAVLVSHKETTQDVKSVVAVLKSKGRDEHLSHRRVYRPWGSYETISEGPGFLVKRIAVAAGGKLSLQMHNHRAEHWVVVHGTARVTRGEQTFDLQENESTYIPVGERHRLENVAEHPLEIIEIQSGDLLSEEDIVRFDDVYGRVV